MKLLITLGLLLLLLPLSFAYEFTEIMYDPLGSDADREWVELYGLPLTHLTFMEGGTAHSLTLIQGNCETNCISIIADNAELFLEEYTINSHVLLYDSSWSSLTNTGETIALINESGDILTELSYQPQGASGESLQLQGDAYSSDQPTPGYYEYQETELEQETISEVPEFGVLSSLFLLGIVGFFILRNRQA